MIYAKLLGILFALGIGLSGYYYVKQLQNEVVLLHKANTKYELVVKELRFNMEGILDDIQNDKSRLDKAYGKIEENRKVLNTFEHKLSKHDLRKIIQRKPKIFEKIAQKGTDKYYEELKEITEWSS